MKCICIGCDEPKKRNGVYCDKHANEVWNALMGQFEKKATDSKSKAVPEGQE